MRALKLEGERFGKLVVIGRAESRPGRAIWNCLCDCGGTKQVASAHLTNGMVRSCGCLVKTHGYASGGKVSKVYRVWDSMVRRCLNPRHKAYRRYGGRGIKVCERWLTFSNFIADMGEPSPGLTLDRINNDGGYEPDNCRWTTRSVQCRNSSNAHLLTHNGQTKTIIEWSLEKGWPHHVIGCRIRAGWTAQRAIETPRRVLTNYTREDLDRVVNETLAFAA